LCGRTSASHLLLALTIAVGLSPYFEIPVLTHQNNLIFPALCSFMRQDVAEVETQAVVSKHLVSVYEASVRRLLPAVKFVLRHLTSRYLACLNGKF
jgi:hypothetical protein